MTLMKWKWNTHSSRASVESIVFMVVVAADSAMPRFEAGRFFLHQFNEFASNGFCFENKRWQYIQNDRLRIQSINFWSTKCWIDTIHANSPQQISRTFHRFCSDQWNPWHCQPNLWWISGLLPDRLTHSMPTWNHWLFPMAESYRSIVSTNANANANWIIFSI